MLAVPRKTNYIYIIQKPANGKKMNLKHHNSLSNATTEDKKTKGIIKGKVN
jgi:hypothetical protein